MTRDSSQQQNNQASSLGKDFFISVVLCMRTNNLTTQYSSYCCLLYVRLSVDHQCYYYYMMMLHNFSFLSPWACMLISFPSRLLSITSLSAILVNNGCYCYRYLVKETTLDLYAAKLQYHHVPCGKRHDESYETTRQPGRDDQYYP